MLIRNGISAPDDDLDVIREQVNGWFLHAQDAFLFAPEVTVYQKPPQRQVSSFIYAFSHDGGFVPDAILAQQWGSEFYTGEAQYLHSKQSVGVRDSTSDISVSGVTPTGGKAFTYILIRPQRSESSARTNKSTGNQAIYSRG